MTNNCGCKVDSVERYDCHTQETTIIYLPGISYCETHARAFRYKEALEKIEARKLEDLPRDKKKDEFHKTLMAMAAWIYCSYTAKQALTPAPPQS